MTQPKGERREWIPFTAEDAADEISQRFDHGPIWKDDVTTIVQKAIDSALARPVPQGGAGQATGQQQTQWAFMLRGLVEASIQLAVLRHNLCYEDEPPIVVEQCSEIVDDVWKALHGIGTWAKEEDKSISAVYAALRLAGAPQEPPGATTNYPDMYRPFVAAAAQTRGGGSDGPSQE